MTKQQTVILSPHLDDAVFNCWHPIVMGNAIILNVFSGMPAEGTRKFWDFLCGEPDGRKMMKIRTKENDEAVSISGATVIQINLDYLDNQYRSGKPNIIEMAESVLEKSPKGSLFLAPLAGSRIFRHPDHILVRKLGVELHNQGHDVGFYPDSPYTTLPKKPSEHFKKSVVNSASQLLGIPVTLQVNELDKRQLDSKKTAMKEYKSQYRMTNLESFGGLRRIGRRPYEVMLRPD